MAGFEVTVDNIQVIIIEYPKNQFIKKKDK